MALSNAVARHGADSLETRAPGPNPFTPDKGTGLEDIVETQPAASMIELGRPGA
ncbi:hypothetical protein [Labrenzia sp. OB1]|uniref:hypothetical protein n=1 Tax=Labrenzia sp. OB1 TaxID=1561204 RepID=UPI000A834289|nr:hypothetical protein [Labrenzia sp. OB1]